MSSYVLSFKEIDKRKLSIVGGKGANLGELLKIPGILVPEGFCVTTEAYKKTIGNNQEVKGLLEELSHLSVEDRDKVYEVSRKISMVIESIPISKDIEEEITSFLRIFGEYDAYAVRSSATAEDLPTASFAGQQDTYLNIIGSEAILKHISKCWASLFTNRAVTYRLQKGFNHGKVHLSVVVQKMVFPQAAGILFTADPVTSNRKVSSIDASFGLGEAVVSGLVNADIYKVHSGNVVDKKISTKNLAIYHLKDGGTKEQEIEPLEQNRQVLTDEQILNLEGIGRRIEEHFGHPQDVEWCLTDNRFYIVQSRPITTLYPIPEGNDEKYHVYISVGHQQMMTDPMKPLGMSIFQLTSFGQRFKAGGRLFVDVAQMLASPSSRGMLLNAMGQHDPLIKDALMTIIEQRYPEESISKEKKEQSTSNGNNDITPSGSQEKIENDPTIVSNLIKSNERSIKELKEKIQSKSGADLFDFILEDIRELQRLLFDPQSTAVFMAAIDASLWLNEKMKLWLGEKNIADILSQSVPNNITSEMGLELLDVADVIRPYPEVVDYLQLVKDDDFLNELVKLTGGKQAKEAIEGYLKKYGMRCVGEIDITKARLSEKPSTLIPMILSNVKNFELNAGKRKFEQGRQEALSKEQELLEGLKQLADGEQKAIET